VSTPPPIVLIEWLDAYASAGWEDDSKAEPAPCKTIGFLIDETDTYVLLAATLGHSTETNARFAIPKGMILTRTVIA